MQEESASEESNSILNKFTNRNYTQKVYVPWSDECIDECPVSEKHGSIWLGSVGGRDPSLLSEEGAWLLF